MIFEDFSKLIYERNSFVDSCRYYVSLLQHCIQRRALAEAKLIHSHINQSGCRCRGDMLLHNTLLNTYAKCGSVVDARRVFVQIPKRDVCSWTVMIAAYSRHGFPEEALILFRQMHQLSVKPNRFTYSSALSACTILASLKRGLEIHERVILDGFQYYVSVANALIDMYAKCGRIETARHIFDRMSEPDVVSWTAIVSGYAQQGFVDNALKLFNEMPQRNIYSWTTMITGFAQNGHGGEALVFYQQMQLAGVKPDCKTLASVLMACTSLAALEQGREIHGQTIRSEFQSDIAVMNALVDMYAKCGSVEDARQVFDIMFKRNVVSWTAMISGYAMHGCGKEALHLFEQMKRSDTRPNGVTFVGVLSACSHAGLVDEGYQYFDCMRENYHIQPTMEHYRCMVDLLGRAGLLDEGRDFIHKMAIKPDAVLWVCFLGACRVHNNEELGEFAAERVFELDPENPAPYVLLSNIYAAGGRWGDIENVRRIMKERGIKKVMGCSWIVVNKQVHAFLGGDR